MRITSKYFTIIFLFISNAVFSQSNVTTVGIQIKPIFPLNFVGTGKQTNDLNGIHFETKLASGFSSGLVIRHSFSDLIALEGGINYVKRKYTLKFVDSSFTHDASFRIIGYEIPVSAVIFAKLGEKLYANGSLGPACDMFASNIVTYDEYYNHVSYRKQVFQLAINGNIGFEYRTKSSGNIYLGLSYHRPFNYIYFDKVKFSRGSREATVGNFLVGNYLTLDLRYFFHEDPDKKVKK